MNKRNTPHVNRITKVEKFLSVTADGNWHSTKELVRRVGHTFGGAKFRLVRRGFAIDVRAHPVKLNQYQYRRIVRDRRACLPQADERVNLHPFPRAVI